MPLPVPEPSNHDQRRPSPEPATLNVGGRSFRCEDCGKVFARKARLQIHTRTHVRDMLTDRRENDPSSARTQGVPRRSARRAT